jgi:hypothetical protein
MPDVDVEKIFRGPPVQRSQGSREVPKAFDDVNVPDFEHPEPTQVGLAGGASTPGYEEFKKEIDQESKRVQAEVDGRQVEREGGERAPAKDRNGRWRDAKGRLLSNDYQPPVAEQPPERVRPEAAPQPKQQGKPSEFPADLVEEAKGLGLSHEDFPNPRALDRAMQAIILAKLNRQARTVEPERAPERPAAPAKQPDPGDALQKAFAKLDSFDPEWAAGVREAINAATGAQQAEIAALKQQLGQAGEQQQARSLRGEIEAFDDWIEANPQFHDVLGKGRHNDVRDDRATVAIRDHVFRNIAKVRASYEHDGEPVPRKELLIKQAFMLAYPDEYTNAVHKAKLDERIEQARGRQRQFIGQPTNQEFRKPAMSERDAAVEAVAAKLEEFGARA